MGVVKSKEVKKRTGGVKRRSQRLKHERTSRNIFAAIKKSLSDIGKGFSQGADKIADIILDSSEKGINAKSKRLKEGSVSVIKDITSSIKRGLKNVKPKDILCEVSHEIGRFSRVAKDTCVGIFNDLME